MSKSQFKYIENKLKIYFNKDKIINCYNNKIKILKEQIKEIDIILERINSTETISIPLEAKLLKKEKNKKVKELFNEKLRLRAFKIDVIDISSRIENIDDTDLKKYIELKYSYNKANYVIAKELNVSEATASRIKKRALSIFLELAEFNDCIND